MRVRARSSFVRSIVLAATLAAALTGSTSAPAALDKGPTPDLQFLGQAIIPTGTQFEDTEIGGLSGIAYDADRNVFYSLSDDPSQIDPARFYTLRIDVGAGAFDPTDVHFLDVTILDAPNGLPFPAQSLDPEGIALTKDGTLVVTSEGFSNRLIDPFVRAFELDGDFIGSLPVPEPFLPNAAATRGVRQNLGFESAATPPNGRFFFTATEAALVQDGPPSTLAAGSPARLLRYNLQTNRLDRQYVYWTDPIAQAPVPPTAFAVSGLVELLPLNNEFLLSMERSFSVGVPGTGNSIKLYRVSLPGATDVNGVASLAGILGAVRPAEKTLLLDLGTLGIPLDNVEGMAFGPDLPDGRRSLILVSDNNFAPTQFTQFLLFAVER